MRGYFAIGVEGISKPMNLGNLLRSSHAFGASFFFTIAPVITAREVRLSDTSDAARHLPFYTFESVAAMTLPRGCVLVGVEFTEQSVDLPSFRHPSAAAYVLGPERGSLSAALQARCDHVVRIPTQFCINVGTAGVIVMYDRMISLGRFPRRPVNPRAEPEARPAHVSGGQLIRSRPRETGAPNRSSQNSRQEG